MLVNGDLSQEKRTSRPPGSSQTPEGFYRPPGQRTARRARPAPSPSLSQLHWIAWRRTPWRRSRNSHPGSRPTSESAPCVTRTHRRSRPTPCGLWTGRRSGSQTLRPAFPVTFQYLRRRSFTNRITSVAAAFGMLVGNLGSCSHAPRGHRRISPLLIPCWVVGCTPRAGSDVSANPNRLPGGWRAPGAGSDVSPTRTGCRMGSLGGWMGHPGAVPRTSAQRESAIVRSRSNLDCRRGHPHPRVEFHRLELRHPACTRFAVRADRKLARLAGRHCGDADHSPHADATDARAGLVHRSSRRPRR